MEFRLFENKSHNDVEFKREHKIEEVLYLSNGEASILVEWFYRVHGNPLKDNYNESNHYVQCYGWEIWDLIEKLALVLNEKDNYKKNLLALWYFPVLCQVNDGDNFNLWSAVYYNGLFNIYNELKKIYSSNSIDNRERLFYYNISW